MQLLIVIAYDDCDHMKLMLTTMLYLDKEAVVDFYTVVDCNTAVDSNAFIFVDCDAGVDSKALPY